MDMDVCVYKTCFKLNMSDQTKLYILVETKPSCPPAVKPNKTKLLNMTQPVKLFLQTNQAVRILVRGLHRMKKINKFV